MKNIYKEYITTLENITIKDFILLINHHAKIKKCSPLISLQAFFDYVSEIPPQELLTTPLNICTIEKIKKESKNNEKRTKNN